MLDDLMSLIEKYVSEAIAFNSKYKNDFDAASQALDYEIDRIAVILESFEDRIKELEKC